jgi:aspartate-semialdehyde dehydrogenase
MRKWNIAIAGATGNVGREILAVLIARKFPVNKIFPLASSVSAGKQVTFKGEVIDVIDASKFDFSKAEIAIFAAGSSFAREYREKVIKAGCFIIDNSSAFRMEDGVPLVVPDVNTEAMLNFKEKKVISNPNCATSPITMALKPLQHYGIKRVVASTYQSVSGAGKKAMDELYTRTKAFFEIAMTGKEVTQHDNTEIFAKDIAFNCIPQIDVFMEDGRTKEEWKMEVEMQKIFNNPEIKVSATCVRVPVFVGHSISVNVEFEKPIDLETVMEELSDFEGLVVVDRREVGGYITPREVPRTFGVFVSRIRIDKTRPNALNMWVVSDNVYGIGAAYNSVRILEELVKII